MPEADDRIRFEKKRIREKTGSEEKQAADTEYEGGVAAHMRTRSEIILFYRSLNENKEKNKS